MKMTQGERLILMNQVVLASALRNLSVGQATADTLTVHIEVTESLLDGFHSEHQVHAMMEKLKNG